jgi:hypothetical protein
MAGLHAELAPRSSGIFSFRRIQKCLLMEETGAKSESTHVVFVDVATTNFASGGITVVD